MQDYYKFCTTSCSVTGLNKSLKNRMPEILTSGIPSFISITFTLVGIEDPTGMVSDLLNEKYFHPDKIGDFKAMTPGLIDVSMMSHSTGNSDKVYKRIVVSLLFLFLHMLAAEADLSKTGSLCFYRV